MILQNKKYYDPNDDRPIKSGGFYNLDSMDNMSMNDLLGSTQKKSTQNSNKSNNNNSNNNNSNNNNSNNNNTNKKFNTAKSQQISK